MQISSLAFWVCSYTTVQHDMLAAVADAVWAIALWHPELHTHMCTLTHTHRHTHIHTHTNTHTHSHIHTHILIHHSKLCGHYSSVSMAVTCVWNPTWEDLRSSRERWESLTNGGKLKKEHIPPLSGCFSVNELALTATQMLFPDGEDTPVSQWKSGLCKASWDYSIVLAL